MFHLLLILAYFIPNIYLFVRVLQLFIDRRYRFHYIIVYTILFSIYPLSLAFGGDAASFGSVLEKVANYMLPFFLYVFICVLVLDILLLVNLFLKIVPAMTLKSKRIRKSALFIVIFISAAIVTAGVINFNTIRTTEYKVHIAGRSPEGSPLLVAFVSDFHLQEDVNIHFVEKFVRKINEIGPDLLLFGGDIVEGDENDGKMEKFEDLIAGIKTRFGMYGVLGNHEHYARQDQGSFFNKAGITILRDSAVIIGNILILAGRNDSHTKTRKSAKELMNSLPDSLPVILMDHRPTEIDQIAETSADIVLSGHTHNGQLFPVNLITRSIYLLSYGHMKKGNTDFFVSSGIRLWGPPVRTTRKSEILLLEINMSEK